MISPLSRSRLKGLLLLVVVGSSVSLIVNSLNGNDLRGQSGTTYECYYPLDFDNTECPDGPWTNQGSYCYADAGTTCSPLNCVVNGGICDGVGSCNCIHACEGLDIDCANSTSIQAGEICGDEVPCCSAGVPSTTVLLCDSATNLTCSGQGVCVTQCGDGENNLFETCDGEEHCDNETCECEFGYRWEEDFSASNSGACVPDGLCGNGDHDTDEECDYTIHDHCNDLSTGVACTCEFGYTFSSTKSACVICGNRDIDPGEECDSVANCNVNSCQCNTGYSAVENENRCEEECGNGIVDPGEQCDDPVECTDQCTCEAPNALHPISRVCEASCGNGAIDNNEQCDASCTPGESDGPDHECNTLNQCPGTYDQCGNSCGCECKLLPNICDQVTEIERSDGSKARVARLYVGPGEECSGPDIPTVCADPYVQKDSYPNCDPLPAVVFCAPCERCTGKGDDTFATGALIFVPATGTEIPVPSDIVGDYKCPEECFQECALVGEEKSLPENCAQMYINPYNDEGPTTALAVNLTCNAPIDNTGNAPSVCVPQRVNGPGSPGSGPGSGPGPSGSPGSGPGGNGPGPSGSPGPGGGPGGSPGPGSGPGGNGPGPGDGSEGSSSDSSQSSSRVSSSRVSSASANSSQNSSQISITQNSVASQNSTVSQGSTVSQNSVNSIAFSSLQISSAFSSIQFSRSSFNSSDCNTVLGCNDRRMTCLNDMCVIINESGPNDCNETIDCGQHTECQNEQCVVVDGDGDNECNDVFDCINSSSSRSMFSLSSEPPGSHTICQNNACIEVPGNGIDECDTVLGCSNEHTACLNNACVILSEPGANECSSVIQCDTHTECRNNQCIIVDGNGSNQCADVFDCLVSSSSRSSFAVSSSSSSAGTSRTSSRDSSSRVSSIARSSRRSIPYFHLACVSESCTYVEGDEPDSCRRGSDDCLPSSTSSQYTIIIALASSSESTKSPVIQIPSSSSQSSLTSSKEPLVAAASICGNGLLENREECDDSNRRDNDGCNSTCLLEIGICGDGVVQSLLGEQCEQSTHNATLPYTCSRCRFVSLYCGNGEIDAGEECDDGPQNSTSPDALCRPDCSLSRCGDGIIDSAEICDDGNRINNDGCDRYCRKESKDSKDPQHTLVASENPQTISQQYQFPQYPTYQQLPYQLPLAQLQPFVQNRAPIGDTGPAAVAVAASGMAAGIGWMRRKRK